MPERNYPACVSVGEEFNTAASGVSGNNYTSLQTAPRRRYSALRLKLRCGRDVAQRAQCRAKQAGIALGGIDHVHRLREAGGTVDFMQLTAFDVSAQQSHREVARASILQNVCETQPGDANDQRGRTEIGEVHTVFGQELWPPVDEYIILSGMIGCGRITGSEYKMLVKQVLDGQARPTLGRIHDTDVQGPVHEPVHESVIDIYLGAQRYVGDKLSHERQPLHEQLHPQREAPANSQHRAVSVSDAGILTRLFECADQGSRVFLKLAPSRRQRGAGLVSHKKGAAQLLFQCSDAGADGGLGYVQAVCGPHKVTRRDDGQESARPLSIHRLI